MIRNLKLLILVLFVITATSLFTIAVSRKKETYKPGISVEFDKAANQAQAVFEQKKRAGIDFGKGPCLTNDLMSTWVADIVHTPREAVDEDPQNQCQALLEGRATHFVELDLKGEVVRVQ